MLFSYSGVKFISPCGHLGVRFSPCLIGFNIPYTLYPLGLCAQLTVVKMQSTWRVKLNRTI